MGNDNLYAASNQWSTRPDDQRFSTLAEMLEKTRHYRDTSREALISMADLRASVGGEGAAEVMIQGKAGNGAKLTHWAFGQLSRLVGAPADYLRAIPADLAAQNLNYGLAKREGQGNLLIHQNGGLVVRSLTSDSYCRIWDCDVIERLQSFTQYGWQVPPARPCREGQAGSRIATEADCLVNRDGKGGLSIHPGDTIAPAGLYASDHDCFVFMVNEERRIADGTQDGMSRGFFLTNSEVGAAALKVTTFLYRHVCGNHIVWGAKNVSEMKIVHRGNADERFQKELSVELRRYADAQASEDEQRITVAQKFSLGANKEEVLSSLFKHLRGDVAQRVIESAYERAVLDSDSDKTIDPRTAWGMAQGLTAHSQTLAYADERNKIDRAAGKVLQMAF